MCVVLQPLCRSNGNSYSFKQLINVIARWLRSRQLVRLTQMCRCLQNITPCQHYDLHLRIPIPGQLYIVVELDIDVLVRSRCLNLTYISQPTLHYTNKLISVSTYAWIQTQIYMCIRSAGNFLQLQKCIRQQNRFVVRTVSLRQACSGTKRKLNFHLT